MLKDADLHYDIVSGAGLEGSDGKRMWPQTPLPVDSVYVEGVETKEAAIQKLTIRLSDWMSTSVDRTPMLKYIKTSKTLKKVNIIIREDHLEGRNVRVTNAFAKAIEANSSLKECLVEFHFAGMVRDFHFMLAAGFLRRAPSITRLVVHTLHVRKLDPFLGWEEGELASAIASLKKLKGLSIRMPWLSLYEKVMLSISDPHKCKHRLELLAVRERDNEQTQATIAYLNSPNASSLTVAQLYCIPEVGAMHSLCQALQSRTTITSLTLSVYGEGEEDAVPAIANYLSNESHLQKLCLDMNGTSHFDGDFFSILQSKQSLSELTLYDVERLPDAWNFLASFLAGNKWLHSLTLIVGTDDKVFLGNLTKGLRMNTNLKRLFIQHGDWSSANLDIYGPDYALLQSAVADPKGESLSVLEHLGVGLHFPGATSVASIAELLGSSECQLQSIAIDVERPVFGHVEMHQGLLSVLRNIQDKPKLKHVEFRIDPWTVSSGQARGVGIPIPTDFMEGVLAIVPQLKYLSSLKISGRGVCFLVGNDTQKSDFLKTTRKNLTYLKTLLFPVDDLKLQVALQQLCLRNKAMEASTGEAVTHALLPLMLESVQKVGKKGADKEHKDSCVRQALYTYLRANPDLLNTKGRMAQGADIGSRKRKAQQAIKDE